MSQLETTYLGLKLKNSVIVGSSGLTSSIEKIKKKSVPEQIVDQINSTYEQIGADLESLEIERNRYFELDYENLCNDTNEIIRKLSDFIGVKKSKDLDFSITQKIRKVDSKDRIQKEIREILK